MSERRFAHGVDDAQAAPASAPSSWAIAASVAAWALTANRSASSRGSSSISDGDALIIGPYEYAQRKLDADPRVVLHERRARPRVAEHEDLLVGKLEPHPASAGGVVDAGEDRQPVRLDGRDQPAHRLRVIVGAAGDDHPSSSAQRCSPVSIRGSDAAYEIRR